MTKETKLYFKLFRKNQKLFKEVIGDKISDEYKQNIVLYLTEIYFGSQHIIKLIEKISETNTNCTKRDLDSLLGNLVDLRIEIYNELIDWVKDLKKPLKTVIDKVEDLWYETDSNNIKKIKCHSALKGSNKKNRK